MKRYTTFKEIDNDLKFLKLKSKIDLEEVKLGIKNSRETISETFSPLNMIASAVASIAKKAFFLKVVDNLLGITEKRR